MRSLGTRWVRQAVAAFCVLLGASVPAGAGEESHPSGAYLPVAVLLFSNHTGTGAAVNEIMPRVYEELEMRTIPYVPPTDLRAALRQHRIRSVGGITEEHARLIRKETGAELVLLGSCDLFLADGNPEVGVSARILDVGTMRIITAQSVAATGGDFAGLFESGRLTDIAEITERVVAQLFDDLDLGFQRPEHETSREPLLPRLALVPLDNLSKTPGAGEVVANILLSELVTRGFDVVEPGSVRGLFLANQRVMRGEVDLPMIRKMSDEFGMSFVATGEVEIFESARGTSETSVPSFSFGARLIGSDGRLTMTFDDERNGSDAERVFKLGRCRSLGRLARHSVQEFVDHIVARQLGASL